jgi:hypothetical protein
MAEPVGQNAAVEVNRPEVLEELSEAFGRYEAALIGNDLATLAELFWESPLAVRFGDGQNLYGHDQITAFRTARSADDVKRDLDRVVITTFGADFATTSAEFRRISSGTRGRQMQTWVRTDGGWRIVAAHVSLLP